MKIFPGTLVGGSELAAGGKVLQLCIHKKILVNVSSVNSSTQKNDLKNWNTADLRTLVPVSYPKDLRTLTPKDMFITVPLTKAETWEQPKCP